MADHLLLARRFLLSALIGPDERFANSPLAVDKFVPEATAIAEKIAVNLAVVPVVYAPQQTITLAGNSVAAESAMHAHRWSGLQVPFAGVMFLQGLVGEDSCGADFHEIAAEFIFQSAILEASEINTIMYAKDVEISATGIIAIESDTSIALDAAVHFMVDERAEVLIAISAFLEAKWR